MNRYLTAAQLKYDAREKISINLGTVIGAFLVHMACYLPVWFFTSFTPSWSIVQIVLFTVVGIAVSIYGAMFVLGENFVALSIACGQNASVNDVFYAFKNRLAGKLSLVKLIPVTITQAVWVMVVLFTLKLSEVMPTNEYMMELLSSGDYAKITALSEELLPYSTKYLMLLMLYFVVTIVVNIIFSQSLFFMLDYPNEDAGSILSKSISLMKGNWGRYLYLQLSFIPWHILAMCTFYISTIWSAPYMRMTYANFYLDIMKNEGENQ